MNINTGSLKATNFNFLLKNLYSKNRNAARSVTRGNIKDDVLVTADSDALKKISKSLRDLEYTKENGEGVYNNVKAFVETYNNLITSSKNSSSYDISHSMKLIKNLTKENKDELEKIGITIAASGKLELKKETLVQCSPQKVASIFSEESDYTKKLKFYSGKIYKTSNYLNNTSRENIDTNKKTPDTNISGTDTTSFINTLV